MMEYDIFKAGVAPGSPTTSDEIKMLLCYILSNIGQSMTFSQLHESLQENGLVNYFELIRTLDKLCETGHITHTADENEPDEFTITKLGQDAAVEFERNIAPAVREKALAAAQRLLKRQRRQSEVSVTATEADGGYLMELAIPEQQLLSVRLFVPTKEQRDLVRRRFLNDPQYIYKEILSLVCGDERVLGDITPQTEQLF